MKFGAVDIGTNSTRLMIADLVEPDGLKTLRREAVITRLGEGVNETSCLSQPAIKRTLEVLADYRSILETNGVDSVALAATSAARDARNSRDFLDRIEKLMGTRVKILSGKEEARLTFLGATYDLSCQLPAASHQLKITEQPRTKDQESRTQQLTASDQQPVLVLDIGGGSTELILGRPSEALKDFSLDIGCVRLTEMFLKSDPPTCTEIEGAEKYVSSILAPAVAKIKDLAFRQNQSKVRLIGVAGTITTLSAIMQRMETYDPDRIHGSRLTYQDIKKMLDIFLSMPVTERKTIVGLESKRADVIIAGTLIALLVLEATNLQEIVVSEHDILDGLVLSLVQVKR